VLVQLRLENYRGFDDHIIPLRSTAIIVGRNNAGKSTIVEALRLVALVSSRYAALPFASPPEWLDLPRALRGVSPSLRNMELNLRTVHYRYGEPPAVVTAWFKTGEQIKIYVGTEAIFALLYNADGRTVSTKGEARNLKLPTVEILPQVGPLAREERILNPEYVQSAMSSSLAPLHFRNQLHALYPRFPEFKRAVEATWPGLRVRNLDGRAKWPSENTLSLFIQDADFTAEASWMGHGLQMWLQTVWFLVRARDANSVILDEPDVYMHADLQRRLIRYLRGRFPQVMIATHSVEIMAEVSPESILIVDRSKAQSGFAASLPAVQRVVEGVGSVHNLHLTRLWSSRRFLMVEGDDLGYIRRFQDAIHPESEVPFDTIPSMEINGWGGWNYAVGSSMFLENAGGEGIVVYCIFDSDFHTPEEIQRRYADAMNRGVQLHVWERKEIENYLLVAGAIQRVIESGLPDGGTAPSTRDIEMLIISIAEQLKDETFDNLASELQKQNRGWDTGSVNKRAREILNEHWTSRDGRVSLVSGKRALSLLSEICKQRFGVSFGAQRIARELRADELPPEVHRVIEAIEAGRAFTAA
jgi:hypothetical protein